MTALGRRVLVADTAPAAARRSTRLRRLPAVAVGVVALAAVVVGWLQDPPPITAAEAVEVAGEGYAAAGLADVEVDPDPSKGDYELPGDGEPIPVWRTEADVDGDTVLLWLARDDAEPVFLDDRTTDGSRHVLTDAEFDVLADLDTNPALDGRLGRNLLVTLAGGLILVLAALHATVPPRLGRELA